MMDTVFANDYIIILFENLKTNLILVFILYFINFLKCFNSWFMILFIMNFFNLYLLLLLISNSLIFINLYYIL